MATPAKPPTRRIPQAAYAVLMVIASFVALGMGHPHIAFLLGLVPTLVLGAIVGYTKPPVQAVVAMFWYPVAWYTLGTRWPASRWVMLAVTPGLVIRAVTSARRV